ncbi:unnamed protein product, partial [Amoebophrya sp. A25]
GSRIDEHADDGPKDYLKKRAVSCVVWLNDQEAPSDDEPATPEGKKTKALSVKTTRDDSKFRGGDFFIEDTSKSDLLADATTWQKVTPKKNMGGFFRSNRKHKVSEITAGNRLSFLCWFTRDAEHCEDFKLGREHHRLSHLTNDGKLSSTEMQDGDVKYECTQEIIKTRVEQDREMPSQVTVDAPDTTTGDRHIQEMFGY